MRLEPLGLEGAFAVVLEPVEDERGWFARSFDAAIFTAAGLDPCVVQCNVSHSARQGTFRGMHYQAEPHGEAKLIRCTRGAVHDVAIDIRPDSPTFRRSIGLELGSGTGTSVFLPPGVAHGFLTLTDDVELTYQMSHEHVPESARGVRWDDPAFAVHLPADIIVISERDRTFPDFVW